MKIPKQIKIGAARYRVQLEPDSFASYDEPDGKKENIGEHITALMLLRVATYVGQKKIPEESLTDTVLHEILHGISRVYGIGLTENQVCGLSGGLMQVIRDNKLDFR